MIDFMLNIKYYGFLIITTVQSTDAEVYGEQGLNWSLPTRRRRRQSAVWLCKQSGSTRVGLTANVSTRCSITQTSKYEIKFPILMNKYLFTYKRYRSRIKIHRVWWNTWIVIKLHQISVLVNKLYWHISEKLSFFIVYLIYII